jgi:hypothetical protein
MIRIAGILFLSFAVCLALGWMLATPLHEINSVGGLPTLADGGMPVPPPPFAFANGAMMADGGMPVPPPPFSFIGTDRADGGMPVPPPPFSLIGSDWADGGMPVPPPPFAG